LSRPKIGVDVRALVGLPSGIGVFTMSMLEHLARTGNAEYLALAHAAVHGESILREAGIAVDRQRAPLGVLWQQLLLRRRLVRADADLFWSPLLTLPIGLDLPSVVTIHDLTPILHPETHSLKVRLSILPFLARTVIEADRIVADSRATAEDISREFPRSAGKLCVVYPGVDPVFEPGDDEIIAATRTELGQPHGYFLFVGTLEPRKNVSMLLDAWESMVGEPSTPGLVIVGAYGWRARHLLKRIRALEKRTPLVYLERIDRQRLVHVYQAARAFVMPSLYEGFGLPVAEAMACGVPTVVTNTSSLPEVVGEAGIKVPLAAPDELARALRKLAGDRHWARELGQRGIERVRRFDWNRAAEAMEEIFFDVLR
jgi:glycosyltransferase involved in cell wall biosynthesis